ncbi:hypothetical protein E3J59_05115, partial [Candidatus Aerophobetes bacterium]
MKKYRLFLLAVYGIAFFLTFGLSKGFPSLLPPVFIYDSEGRRDPFVSVIEKKLSPEEDMETQIPQVTLEVEAKPKEVTRSSEFTLVSLAWGGEETLALIQGRAGAWIVKEGDLIGEFLVLEIKGDQGEVTLEGVEKIV